MVTIESPTEVETRKSCVLPNINRLHPTDRIMKQGAGPGTVRRILIYDYQQISLQTS